MQDNLNYEHIHVEGGDYDADELIKLLDDYAEIAPAKFEVDNKDGGVAASLSHYAWGGLNSFGT